RSTAGPTAVTASSSLPSPPSPLSTRTVVNGIHSLWRSHARRAANTVGAGAFTTTDAVTSTVLGCSGVLLTLLRPPVLGRPAAVCPPGQRMLPGRHPHRRRYGRRLHPDPGPPGRGPCLPGRALLRWVAPPPAAPGRGPPPGRGAATPPRRSAPLAAPGPPPPGRRSVRPCNRCHRPPGAAPRPPRSSDSRGP